MDKTEENLIFQDLKWSEANQRKHLQTPCSKTRCDPPIDPCNVTSDFVLYTFPLFGSNFLSWIKSFIHTKRHFVTQRKNRRSVLREHESFCPSWARTRTSTSGSWCCVQTSDRIIKQQSRILMLIVFRGTASQESLAWEIILNFTNGANFPTSGSLQNRAVCRGAAEMHLSK